MRLRKLISIDSNLSVELVQDIPEIERKIVLEEPHFNRGDLGDYLIRSTMSRVKYKGHDFKIFNTPDVIKRGDIIIESSLFGHYAGELQIATKDMKNTGKSNVVGHVIEEERFLLDRIKPWQKFRLYIMKYYLGIDAGGTFTRMVLFNQDGDKVDTLRLESIHYMQVGFDGIQSILERGKNEFITRGYSFEMIAVAIGTAGYGNDSKIRAKIENAIWSVFPNALIMNDAQFAMVSDFG
ncbi:DUF871 family protein [Erysipelothrix sp. Poltava]|nr:DUF871 family protein [Erysipelothrix sp. Poltava]